MHTESTQSLAGVFPQFRFVPAADAFITRFASWEIEAQLLERKITRVEIVSLTENARLIPTAEGFTVQLNQASSQAQQVVSLGEQIAHTFHYNVCLSPPKNLIEDDDGVKLFCGAFSSVWIAHTSPLRLTDWIRAKSSVPA